MLAKKTLELNPHHPVIKELLQRVKTASAAGEEVDSETSEYGTMLYNMGLLNSGFLIENPVDFLQPLHRLLKLGFGLSRDAAIEEIEVEVAAEDEAEGGSNPAEEEEEDVEGEAEVEDVVPHNEEL
jgi:hypothetical protein